MKASKEVKAFIKRHEGLSLVSYRCPAGVWTIGYGHTGADVRPGMAINLAMARELFESDLAKFEVGLGKLIAAQTSLAEQLTQNRYDALLSFGYNVGLEALKSSTLWKKVCANPNDETIAGEFARWIYAKGTKLPGLIKRRAGEAEIWQANQV